jgi:hypothetical protein
MKSLNRSRLVRRARAAKPPEEAGYALLMAMFIGALMIVGAAVAIPNLITEQRRQNEALMIWRGKQYARAIGLFYRKTGRFPHDLEELEKGVGDVHFLRKAYKDPMNAEDGSWRLIYLGPGGQLIGSLCWQTLAQYQAAVMGVSPQMMGMAVAPGVGPVAAAPGSVSSNGSAFGNSAVGSTTFGTIMSSGTPTSGAAAMAPAPTCGAGMAPTAPQSSAFPNSPQSGTAGSAPQAGAPNAPQQPGGFSGTNQFGGFGSTQPKPQIIEEGQMVGGNLVGVASKAKEKSLKVYLGGTTYRQWEFIWNPLQGQATGAVAPATAPANGQQPNTPNSPSPFGPPQPPGAAIPPGPGFSPSNPPASPGPG